MLIVGKPGSGKSTVMENLVNSPDFYNRKFDNVYLVTPSTAKLNINIPPSNVTTDFNLEWIYDKIHQENLRQEWKLHDIINNRIKQITVREQLLNGNTAPTSASLNELYRPNNKNGTLFSSMPDDLKTLHSALRSVSTPMYKHLERQQLGPILGMHADPGSRTTTVGGRPHESSRIGVFASQMGPQRKRDAKASEKDGSRRLNFKEERARLNGKVNEIQDYGNRIQKLYMQTLGSQEELENSHKNVLLLLDDVVSDIKANENHPALSKLFFNRRHMLGNGTISTAIVSQKFTSIPQKIRTNSNWLVLFRLNPVELENVWKDTIVLNRDNWQGVLNRTFGDSEEDARDAAQELTEQIKNKKYDNLGIWVEFNNAFFKNFNKLQ